MEQRISDISIYVDTLEIVSVKVWQTIIGWQPEWLFISFIVYWNLLFWMPSLFYMLPVFLLINIWYGLNGLSKIPSEGAGCIEASLIQARQISDQFFGNKSRFYGEVLRMVRERVSAMGGTSSTLISMSMSVLSIFSAPPSELMLPGSNDAEYRRLIERRFERIVSFLVILDLALAKLVQTSVTYEQFIKNPKRYPDLLLTHSYVVLVSLLLFYHVPLWIPFWFTGNLGLLWNAPARKQVFDWTQNVAFATLTKYYAQYLFRRHVYPIFFTSATREEERLATYYPSVDRCLGFKYLFFDVYTESPLQFLCIIPKTITDTLCTNFGISKSSLIRIMYCYENQMSGELSDPTSILSGPMRLSYTDELQSCIISLDILDRHIDYGRPWLFLDSQWQYMSADVPIQAKDPKTFLSRKHRKDDADLSWTTSATTSALKRRILYKRMAFLFEQATFDDFYLKKHW